MKTLSVYYCLLYAVSTEAADIYVDGFVGGNVSFQCSHKLAWNNNKYFCKDPCESPDVLATVAPRGQAHWGRIALEDSGNGVFRVSFTQLQLSDSRKYYCAVDRSVADTYTAVHLTVKEVHTAVTGETTTVRLDTSSAWTQPIVTNSAQSPTEIDNVTSADILTGLTASNVTSGPEQDSNFNIILCATTVGVLVLVVLILVACVRKCREISKPQPAGCSSSTNKSNALETEVDCDYDDIDVLVQGSEKLSGSSAIIAQQPRRDPAAQRAAGRPASLQLYQNVPFSKRAAAPRVRPARDQRDTTPRLYIRPLQCKPSDRPGHGASSKKNKRPAKCKNTKDCKSNTTARLATSQFDEVTQKSLWFGLDVSGLN